MPLDDIIKAARVALDKAKNDPTNNDAISEAITAISAVRKKYCHASVDTYCSHAITYLGKARGFIMPSKKIENIGHADNKFYVFSDVIRELKDNGESFD